LWWSRGESIITGATKWPVVLALHDDDDDECGAIGAMLGKVNLSN
jgi:hypothetical protein